MKNIILKVVASIAFIVGLLATIMGTRALTGSFDPGYDTLMWLISYNVFMGIVSLVAGVLIWKEHAKSLMLGGIITGAHITVLLSLVTVFSSVVAHQSVKAMIFRSAVWIILFLLTRKFLIKSDKDNL